MGRQVINNRYTVLRKLGEGGMGTVYLVRDRVNSLRMALKRIRSKVAAGDRLRYFKGEFRALTRLSHPNLVRVYDFDLEDPSGECFFTSEYVDGVELFQATEGIPEAQLYELIVQVCRGLEYIHSRGFIHYDIKPENILVTRDRSGTPLVKIMDFGLAEDRSLGGGLSIKGTLRYIAPEVARRQPVDRRADLYSLGVVLYQVATRRLPFDERSSANLIRKHIEVVPVPPVEVRPDCPHALSAIVMRLIEKDPARRYQGAKEVIAAIAEATGTEFPSETAETRESYISTGRFVGRAGEFRHLVAVHRSIFGERAPKEQRSRPVRCVVLVGGEQGSGKTRLLREVRTYSQLGGVPFVIGASGSSPGGAYGAFVDLLREAVPLASAAGDAAGAVLVARDAPYLARLVPEVVKAFEASEPVPLTPEQERLRLHDAVARFLVDLSRFRPLVLALEDLQWADAGTLAMAGQLARVLAHARAEEPRPPRLLLVATYRDDSTPEAPLEAFLEGLRAAPLAPRTLTLRLGRLDEQAVAELVNSMLGRPVAEASSQTLATGRKKREATVLRRFIRRIATESGGNPYFVQEFMKNLSEDALFYFRDGEWRVAARRFADLDVPATVREVVLSRHARLDRPDAALCATLAAIGHPVPLELAAEGVSTLCPMGGPEVQERVDRLVKRGFLRSMGDEGDRSYTVEGRTFAEVCYEHVGARRRRALHEGIARAIERRHGERPYAHLEELARHWREGGGRSRARGLLIASGEKALALYANDRAVRFFEEARSLLRGATPDERRATWMGLALVHGHVGHPDRALDCYRRVLGIREALDAVQRAGVRRRSGLIHVHRGEYREALTNLQKGLADLGDGHPTDSAHLIRELGVVAFIRGELEEAEAHCQRALAVLEGAAPESRREADAALASVYLLMGSVRNRRHDYDDAIRHFQLCRTLCERIDEVIGLASCYNNLGNAYIQRGEYEEAGVYYRNSLEIRTRIGEKQGIANSLNNLGCLEGEMGNYPQALRYHREGLAICETMGLVPTQILFHSNLGQTCLEMGRYGDARTHLARSLAMAQELGLYRDRARDLAHWAHLHALVGQPGAARKALTEAARLLGEGAPAIHLAHQRTQEGGVALREGAWEAARTALDEALAVYRGSGEKRPLCEALLLAAEAAWGALDADGAAALLSEALPHAAPLESKVLMARYFLLKGIIESGRGKSRRAGEYLAKALRYGRETRCPEAVWEIEHALGRWHHARGDTRAAGEHYRRAGDLIKDLWGQLPEDLRKDYLLDPRRRQVRQDTERLIRQVRRGADLSLTEAAADHPAETSSVSTRRHSTTTVVVGAAGRAVRPGLDPEETAAAAMTELRADREAARTLLAINARLNREHDPEQLLEMIVDGGVELTGAQRGVLLLVEGTELVPRVSRAFRTDDGGTEAFSRGVAREVVQTGRTLLVTDARGDERLAGSSSVAELDLRSVLCVPLRTRGQMCGALYVDHRAEAEAFGRRDREVLEAFADQAGIALENARLHQQELARQAELARRAAEVERLNTELAGLNRRLQTQVDHRTAELEEERARMEEERRSLALVHTYGEIVGASEAMRSALRIVDRVTDSPALPVLILGESGTGKELVA
ncbi:MAG: tetratricopeptide repeat protein, partial [Planctomycetes bacterium]|nr:tetratricopeptide repeat protein [Planctomycetota bacterium]